MTWEAIGLIALGFWAGLPPAGPTGNRQAERGKVYFDQYCIACHGATATGDGIIAESLKAPPPDLTRFAARREGVFKVDELVQIIDGRLLERAHGVREMPVWGEALGEGAGRPEVKEGRAERRIDAIVAYLKTLQRP